MPTPERRYDERELAQILQAAAAAQAQGAVSVKDSSGFSLAEIERLASEVGIDSKHVLGALSRLDEHSTPRERHFWGAPNRGLLERNFNGTLSGGAWEEVTSELQALLGSGAHRKGSVQVGSGHQESHIGSLRMSPQHQRTVERAFALE